MPKGPNAQKRPADGIGTAVTVMRIAPGSKMGDAKTERAKIGRAPVRSAAATLGSLGGKARAATLTKRRRAEIAKIAAAARWKKT